jgi:hypothetical protein
MTTGFFSIPAWIAARAWGSRNLVERACLLGWANAALAYFWTLLTIAALTLTAGGVSHAQTIGTLQASPNIGLDFDEPQWADGSFVFDPVSQSGVLSLDYASGRVFAAPGGTISGTFTANLTAEGPGTLNAQVAILALPDRSVLWASPVMSACCGYPHDPLIAVAVPYSFAIPPFPVPPSGQLELAYSSAPSSELPSDDPCDCGTGGGWGGQDPGFVLVEAAAAFGTVTTFAPLPLQAKFATFALTALSGTAAAKLTQLANDPLDPDYTDIAMPTAYPVPAGGTCVVGIAGALANLAGLADAASTSFNRMQYAISIGDTYWRQQQGQAMLSYAVQVDSILKTLRKQFSCLPVRGTATAADITAFQQNLATNGPSSDMLKAWAAEGVTDPTDINNMVALITSADPNQSATMFNALFGPRPRQAYWQALRQSLGG